MTQSPASGWGVATAAGETVALDLSVTPSLRAEGLAREVIRRVQEARKASGLAVTDRIDLRWSASSDELSSALAVHADLIAGEVLAVSFRQATRSPDGWHEHEDADLGLRFWLTTTR